MTSSITAQTSRTSPLRIAELQLNPGEGVLGLTLCPGKKDLPRHYRDLRDDLRVIRAWNATTVVSLIEDHEFFLLGVQAMQREVRALGMDWIHLPIVDVDIPDDRFERSWALQGPKLHGRLDAGERVLIHCRGGRGRTGLVAAIVLVERGCGPSIAISRVRAVRPHAIETVAQQTYVERHENQQASRR